MRRWKLLSRGAFGSALILCGLVSLSGPSGASGTLELHLSGSYGGTTSSGVVIGEQQGHAASGVVGRAFSFNATCVEAGAVERAVACGPVTYNFGDNTSAVGASSISHGYGASGQYSVTASVSAKGYAAASMTALVSPLYVDVSGPYARAIWALGALGFGSACSSGVYCVSPKFGGGPGGTVTLKLAKATPLGATSLGLVGSYSAPAGATLIINGQHVTVTKSAGSVVTISPGTNLWSGAGTKVTIISTMSSPDVNGITGQSCLINAGVCGLSQVAFSTSNESASCSATCVATLEREGELVAGVAGARPRLAYNATNCLSGYVASKVNGAWQVGSGLPSGCESRGEFLSELVDLAAGGSSRLAKSPCSDSSSAVVRRGAALGLTKALVIGGKCYLGADLTKGVAFQMLGALGTKKNVAVGDSFIDLAHSNLVGPPVSYVGVAGGLLAGGTPLTGSAACPRSGRCFNPEAGLTRGEAAGLLASILLGTGKVSGGTSIQLRRSGGDVVAVVRGATGESPTTVSVDFSGPGSNCHVAAVISGGKSTTLTCPAFFSVTPSTWSVSVTRGWGSVAASLYLAKS